MSKKEIIFTEKEITQKLKKTAKEINRYYADILKDKESLITIPILKGGMFFYVDLVRKLTMPVQTGVVAASHYPNGKEISKPKLQYIDTALTNRHILLVDEICYTGETLLYLKSILMSLGAKDVRTAVLINQPKEHEHIIHIPDWSVLKYYGKKWCIGCGMDLKGLYRNSQDIFYFRDD